MRYFFHQVTVLLIVSSLPLICAEPARDKPNVVIILADDLGYGDVHCYNPERGKIPTPHLDRLAGEGMRFTDGHSSSGVCSPSRYTLLTGRYHWRTRLQTGIVGAWEKPLIAPDRLTLAGMVKAQGYRTACIGKWHLGWDWPATPEQRKHLSGFGGKAGGGGKDLRREPTAEDQAAWQAVFSQPIAGGPISRGFERYFGTDVPNWPPYCFIDNDRTVGIPSTLLPAAFLEKNMASTQGPALPAWTLEPILPALVERASAFITESAAAKQPFLLYMPLTTPHTPLAVNAAWKGKSGLNSAVADLVMETDDAVGRIMAVLTRSGVSDNTLVVFLSDNGMAPYTGAAALEAQGHFPSGPLRGYKGDTWEGGHRTPFIVRWPTVVSAGQVCPQLVHHADVMATVAEALAISLPGTAGEDSFSLMPLLRGGKEPVRTHAISAGMHGVPGLRVGTWKLIPGQANSSFNSNKASADKEQVGIKLFDLATDLGETTNLAEREPQRVRDMQLLLERLIADGRSTPGPAARNDVDVRRYPSAQSALGR